MCKDTSYDVAPDAVRRRADGTPDTEFYLSHAHDLRAAFLRAMFACLARGRHAWACVRAKMQEQASLRTLSTLSQRELKDLGLTRGDIEAVVSGAYFTDATRSDRRGERLGKCA